MAGLKTKTPYRDIFVQTKHPFYEFLGIHFGQTDADNDEVIIKRKA